MGKTAKNDSVNRMKTLGIRLPVQDHERLEKLASLSGTTPSALARSHLMAGLDDTRAIVVIPDELAVEYHRRIPGTCLQKLVEKLLEKEIRRIDDQRYLAGLEAQRAKWAAEQRALRNQAKAIGG